MSGGRLARWRGSWRVAVRIARRDALRSRGRTALVATMIGLPVLVGAGGGVLVQSSQVTPAREVAWDLGEHVQARVYPYQQAGIEQSPDGSATGIAGAVAAAPAPGLAPYQAQLAGALPAGARLVTAVEGTGSVTTGDRTTDRDRSIIELPAADLVDVVVPPVAHGTLPAAAGEVAVDAVVADELGVAVGDAVTVTPAGGPPSQARVVGVLASWPRQWGVVAVTGSLLPVPADAGGLRTGDTTCWFVLGDAPVTWDVVQRINALGSTVRSRAVILDPPPPDATTVQQGGGGVTGSMVAVGAGVAAMGLIEAVLLIGPAFAVGARRSQRQLALLAATGAERRVLRRVVTVEGVVVGLGASAVAAVAGVAVGALARWAFVARGSFAFPDLRVPWWAVPALLVLGTVVATAAAAVPAGRASRVDVVAALAGRRAEARPRRGVPVTGVVLAAAGVAAALAGATMRRPMLIVPGVLAIELGLVFASGALVSLVGRLSPLLGLAGRFATRDAARQRSRTAPALAAIIAAIGGLTAGVVYVQSAAAQQQASYEPLGALGTVAVSVAPPLGGETRPDEARLAAAGEVLRARLPVSDVAVVRVAVPPADAPAAPSTGGGVMGADMTMLEVVRTPDNECPDGGSALARAADDRCVLSTSGVMPWWVPETFSRWPVDDGTVVRMLGLPGSAAAADALAAGKVVVRSPHDLQPDGTVQLVLRAAGDRVLASADLPAAAVDLENAAQLAVVLPPSAVTALGVDTAVVGLVAATTQPPTPQQVDAVRAGLDPDFAWQIDVERGPQGTWGPLVWIVAGAAMLVGLAATAIALALAAAESRPDLATLGAVGAAPRVRRRVAAAQAGVLTITGVVLGVLTGLLLGRVLVTAQRAAQADPTWTTVVPWPVVATVLAGVPLLAMGGAWLLTRSRLPMVRRVVG